MNDAPAGDEPQAEPRGRAHWLAVALAALIAIGFVAWLVLVPDIDILAELDAHRAAILSWRDRHFAASIVLFALAYFIVVVLSLPVNFAMTAAAGFLFGVMLGTVLAIAATTTAALVVFSVTRAKLGTAVRRRALANGSNGLFARMDRGFRRNGLWYLVLLRLAPTFPSMVGNAAPAFFGVRLRTFALATLISAVPSSLATAWIGASLATAVARGELAALLSGHHPFVTALALASLLLLAALPTLMRRRGRP